MSGSTVSFEKPLPHKDFSDWTSALRELQLSSDGQREFACNLRHSAQKLRKESKLKTEWDSYHNDNRLNDRVQEVMFWRSLFQSLLDEVDKELAALRSEKASTDREVDAINIFNYVTSECLSNRDARRATELTNDLANEELKKELHAEKFVTNMLSEYCQLSWEKINELEKLRFKLILDIENKTEAISIDYNQLALSKDCATNTFKPDAVRVPKNSVSHKQWLDSQRSFLAEGEKELRLALAAREQLFLARGRAKNTLRAQCDATEYALRRRIYETKRAHTELVWQKEKVVGVVFGVGGAREGNIVNKGDLQGAMISLTIFIFDNIVNKIIAPMENNMGKLIAEMSALEAAILAKTNALKLAQTRLENRYYRPPSEMVIDFADEGIKREFKAIQKTIKTLKEKFDLSKATYNALESQCLRIATDLEDKSNTMEIDGKALKVRDAAREAPDESQADRSIDLVNFQGRIPAS